MLQEDERGVICCLPTAEILFPDAVPEKSELRDRRCDPADPYARFYSDHVVGTINALALPDTGSATTLSASRKPRRHRSRPRLSTACPEPASGSWGSAAPTLFKRLESAGPAFLLSIERHILRNFIVLHAMEKDLDIPLGTQGAELLDTRYYDEDPEDAMAASGSTMATMKKSSMIPKVVCRDDQWPAHRGRFPRPCRQGLYGLQRPLQESFQVAAQQPVPEKPGQRFAIRCAGT
jgi:hypothetical protein